MEFTERRYSVLLVSSSPKFNESMLALLPESRFYPVAAVSDVSSARRRLLESKYDIVIINAPLPDDFGTRLALYICENSGAGVLLLVKAEHYPDINGRVSPFGVLVLPKPATSQAVSQSLQLLCGTRGTPAAHGTKNRLHRGKDGGDTHNKPREAAAYGAAEDDGKGGASLH